MEKYFINQYHSNDKRYGYNILSGGQDSSGENNPSAKLKQAQVDALIDDLINTDISYKDLMDKYGVNIKYIANVNSGTSWRNDELYTYPLRKMENRLDEETVSKIIDLLQYSDKTIDEIEEETGVKRYTILSINRGNSHRKDCIVYPIKELSISKQTIFDIMDKLKSSTLSCKEIANQLNVSVYLIYRINCGQAFKQQNCSYPIRKISIERNELGQYSSGNQS